MASLLNIIHPYTYHLEGSTLVIGGKPEWDKRDENVGLFIRQALDVGARVLLHGRVPNNTLDYAIEMVTFRVSAHYDILFDDRLEYVVTTPGGIPIHDERPEKISVAAWNEVLECGFATHSELASKMRDIDVQLFIGGALECCVANMAVYAARFYRSAGQRLCCVRDLCVSFDEKERIDTEKIMVKHGVEIILLNDATEVLRKNYKPLSS